MLRTAIRAMVVALAVIVCFTLLHSAAFAIPAYGVLTVGNDTDTSGLACTGSADCNLRSAIEYANTHGGDWAIIFTTGVHTFTLSSPLIVSGSAISITANAGQTVFVNANNAGNAFQLSGSDVMLNNLYIYGSSAGYSNIWIKDSAQRVTISNNYIGGYPEPSGGVQCTVSPNSYSGIYINSGGAIAPGSARAWIYGNTIDCNKGYPGDGIDILTDNVLVGADATGTDRGNTTEFNHGTGLLISGSAATHNVIQRAFFYSNQNGIVITGSAQLNNVLTNTLQSNANLGVWLSGGACFNAVRANDIHGQGNTGVQIDAGAHDNEIGSAFLSSGNGNHIYSNAREGVYISGADTRNNAVRDNRIGVDGQNGQNGVVLDNGTHSNVIGDILIPGGTPTGRNIISGNGMNGVDILNGAHDNIVGGNYIGTTATGTGVFSNTWSGVAIYAGAHHNTLDQNLIGGNGVDGVVIDGSTTSTNALTLNQIGYNNPAMAAIPNGWDGLALGGGTFGNIIGGSSNLPNIIGDNTGSGIFVYSGAHHNSILMNYVALNHKYGLLLDGSATTNNVISGTWIYDNLLDGLAERNDAVYNTWAHVSTFGNGGLGINTQAVDESTHVPHPPFLVIAALDRSTGWISGKANVTGGLFATKVELYRPAPDPSGYGEGQTFVGSAFTDSFGNWSIHDPAFTGCYTGFTTETTVLGTGSTEFIRNNCLIFLPTLLK